MLASDPPGTGLTRDTKPDDPRSLRGDVAEAGPSLGEGVERDELP
jgi:hypothetical protein